MVIIAHQPLSPQTIHEMRCPECGGTTTIDFAHVGGYSQDQPFVVCIAACNQSYYKQRLTEQEYRAYLAWIREQTDKAVA